MCGAVASPRRGVGHAPQRPRRLRPPLPSSHAACTVTDSNRQRRHLSSPAISSRLVLSANCCCCCGCIHLLHSQAAVMSQWQAIVDATSGNTYYAHVETGETTWTRPAELDDAPSSAAAEVEPLSSP